MKIYKIAILSVLALFGAYCNAQNIKLDTYKFGEGFNFSSDDGFRIELSGFLQPFVESRKYTEVEENSRQSRFRMRRLRFRIEGNLKNERFKYRFAFDLSGSSEAGDNATSDYLLDAFVSYDITNRIKATFGQRSTFTDNRELFMASQTLQLVERSRLTSAFSSIREFGLFLQGTFRTGGGTYLRPYFVLSNGDGINAFGKDYGGVKVGGRLDFLPFGLFTNKGQFREVDMVREPSPKLVIGANLSQNNGMSSRRGRGNGDILYLNNEDEVTLPDYTKYGVDFLFKYRGFSVLGEFVKTNATVPDDITQRVRNDGSTSTNFEIDGEQNVENYVKNRMMLGDAFNIQAGYIFKNGISVDGRYTRLNADEYSFMNNATFYNRPNYYTIGLSYYLTRSYGAKIQASYTYVDGSDGINNFNSEPIPGNENILRLSVTVAF